MKKTLRKRFIVFAMSAVTILLLFLAGAINGLNWILLEKQSDRVLEILVQADGTFHKMDFNQPPPFIQRLDMDTMRAARFFMVRSNREGEILDINIDQISAVDRITAEKYANTVFQRGNEQGWVGNFKYAIKQLSSDQLIIFMDISNLRSSFLTVLFVSCVIAVVSWIIVLLFVILLSGKMIRPILIGMEKQKQFITNAGHELKTPLAIIQANNDAMVLIHGENKYNSHIRTQTKRLNVLMSNLLILAKLDEEIPLTKELVNISVLTAELLPAYQDTACTRQLRMDVQIEPDITMLSNRNSFSQMLTVLLDNAVKYTSDGGMISLTLIRRSGHVFLIAENTCNPTCSSDPERLFERFYRGDSARTQDMESSGYGIGLSAARAICENFGGTLTAEYPSSESIRFTARF